MADMEDAYQVLNLYELHYSDLMLLSSSSSNNKAFLSSPKEEAERLEAIKTSIIETLGPTGPGLLSICAVPFAPLLRRRLLPLARHLSLLDHDSRKRILKEHNLGSDVSFKNPGRNVSSFAMQLKYSHIEESDVNKPSCRINSNSNLDQSYPVVDDMGKYQDNKFENLGNVFKELGYCMMELGLRVAQICDKAIGGQELERSLLESGTAKGRLIHYHSALDNVIVKETGRRNGSKKREGNSKSDRECSLRSEGKELKGSNLVRNGNEVGSLGNSANLWQQWHYDYGIFTVLTAPMFFVPSDLSGRTAENQSLVSCDQECAYPSGNSCLQIFDPNKNDVIMVNTSPESFIVQVGESADILSKGKLRSTLHSVSRPSKLENLSRQTFVVFLQPAWGKTFSVFDYCMGECMDNFSNEENNYTERDLNRFTQEIHKIVPPLSSRLKDGMTFAEFSRETTKQYYGGSGLQSNG